MLFALCLLSTSAVLSLAVIVAGLRRAPEAYEDEHGLRIIRASSRQATVSLSAPRASTRSRYWRIAKMFSPSGEGHQARKRLSAKA